VKRLHPLVEAAAHGEIPDWAEVTEERREHLRRVGALMGGWARALGLGESNVVRFAAAGCLHDVLRDARPDSLRPCVPPDLSTLPDPLLHGPAAAGRLRVAGVDDGELLFAVSYHTLGHERFGGLGRALYAADFLDPGREFLVEWRAGLRERSPADLTGVVREILSARIRQDMEELRPLRPETVGFWNSMAGEA
jgi:2-amino-4-hydroxy-6-hydroxymethyldihydropteridine diphosphokinase